MAFTSRKRASSSRMRGRTVRRRLNFGRPRFRRRVRRFTGYTNRASGATSVGRFRTRRTRPSTFRRRLWNASVDKSHYRSVGAATLTVPTPITNILTTATLQIITPGNAFWTVAGGAQPEDTGVLVPSFSGDITLRGGVTKLTIANRTIATEVTPTDNVRVTVFTVWTNPAAPVFIFPTTVPISWDPSVFPDFQRYGRVIGRREAILSASGDTLELSFRHRVQRIDQAVFNAGGNRLQYFVLVSETTNSDATGAEQVDITNAINYSFAADAQ